jgi:organic radical activating enzyme
MPWTGAEPSPTRVSRACQVNLKEIIDWSFHFHQLVYVSLTQKCPITCRHCFVESGPRRDEHIPPAEFESWIGEIAQHAGVRAIVFSGGEPFSHPGALKAGLAACAAANKYSIISTSGYWASRPDLANRFLDNYPAFNALWLSTDVFHEEFVPLSNLRVAAEVAAARNSEVFFQIVDDDPENSEFMRRFEGALGPDLASKDRVYIVPLSRIGRGRDLEPNQLVTTGNGDADRVPDMPCPWLGAPWVHEDSSMCACPNLDVHRQPDHVLKLGKLGVDRFQDASGRADQDWFVQALRVYGPRSITEMFPLQQWGWQKDVFHGSSICDLCHSITGTPGLVERIRAEVAQSQPTQSEMKALRLFLYGELSG